MIYIFLIKRNNSGLPVEILFPASCRRLNPGMFCHRCECLGQLCVNTMIRSPAVILPPFSAAVHEFASVFHEVVKGKQHDSHWFSSGSVLLLTLSSPDGTDSSYLSLVLGSVAMATVRVSVCAPFVVNTCLLFSFLRKVEIQAFCQCCGILSY